MAKHRLTNKTDKIEKAKKPTIPLSTEEQIKLMANLIVDRILEDQDIDDSQIQTIQQI